MERSFVGKEDALKTFILIVLSSLYIALAAGYVTGELAVRESRCLHCRFASAGVTTPTASASTRKVMRYHGVSVLKTVHEDTYVLFRGKWIRVGERGGT